MTQDPSADAAKMAAAYQTQMSALLIDEKGQWRKGSFLFDDAGNVRSALAQEYSAAANKVAYSEAIGCAPASELRPHLIAELLQDKNAIMAAVGENHNRNYRYVRGSLNAIFVSFVDADGALKTEGITSITNDPVFSAQFKAIRNELCELGTPSVPITDARILQQMIEPLLNKLAPTPTLLLDALATYGRTHGIVPPPQSKPSLKLGAPSGPSHPLPALKHAADPAPSVISQRQANIQAVIKKAKGLFDSVMLDDRGNLRADAFLKEPTWQNAIAAAKANISDTLGIPNPPSDAVAAQSLLDDPALAHAMATHIIRLSKRPRPVATLKTDHVSDDPKAWRKIIGEPVPGARDKSEIAR